MFIDAHRGWGGVRGVITVYPPSTIFAKLVNKKAIKHQKVVPYPQNFHNPYIPSVPKFGKNLPDPPPGFSNRVHLWLCCELQLEHISYIITCHFVLENKWPHSIQENRFLLVNVYFSLICYFCCQNIIARINVFIYHLFLYFSWNSYFQTFIS